MRYEAGRISGLKWDWCYLKSCGAELGDELDRGLQRSGESNAD
jgi:hypothetical protein